MTPILPPSLQPGDAIGFFSPSSPATVYAPQRFARATDYLTARGFRLVEGNLTGQQDDGYRSGSIRERAEELNQLIRDPQVRCIMSTIGGMNSNALLPYLDYAALKDDPKIIIGYSDVTALLLGIYAQTGLVTFYGPALVASFGELPPLVDETYHNFAELLCQPCVTPYHYALPSHWSDERLEWESQSRPKLLRENTCRFEGTGVYHGRLIGGNLNTMGGIWGSPYMPEIREGDVLLLEDGLKEIETVERSFAWMALNGVFERVSCVLLGKHELFDDQGSGKQPIDVLREVLGETSVPVVVDFDCAHTHPMLTMPLGGEVQVDFDEQQVSLVQPWVAVN